MALTGEQSVAQSPSNQMNRLIRSFHTTVPLNAMGFGDVKYQVHSGQKMFYRNIDDPRTVSLVGAPVQLGQPFEGPSEGPQVLRKAGVGKLIEGLNWKVEDLGDLDCPPSASQDPKLQEHYGIAHNCFALGMFSHTLANTVSSLHAQRKLPLVLGGDHSLGFASIAGALRQRKDLGVLWVDAHADINTPMTSLSGNMHGMPVAIAMGLCDGMLMPGFDWFIENKTWPRLAPSSIVYVGLRDLDSAEVSTIRNLGIKCFTMSDIDRYGIGQTMENALSALDASNRPIHVSFDIDAVDPMYAPSTGTSVRGGLTYREAHYLMEAVAASGGLVSMDLVEVNADLSPTGSADTLDMGKALIGSALGNRIL